MVSMDVVHDRQFGAALFFFLHNRKPRKSAFFSRGRRYRRRGGTSPPRTPPLQRRGGEKGAFFNLDFQHHEILRFYRMAILIFYDLVKKSLVTDTFDLQKSTKSYAASVFHAYLRC